MRLISISFGLVVLIGIVFILPSLFGRIVHTKQSRVPSDLRSVEIMLNLYHSDYGFYPNTLNELITDKKFGPYLVWL